MILSNSPLRLFISIFLLSLFCASWRLSSSQADEAVESPKPQDASARIVAAIDYWRDKSSYTVATMTIHRENWERTSRLEAWTKGFKLSLVRFVFPAKDAGNASLTKDNDMWSYSPKINRVVKIPSSLMNQSWMGSDFSYNDLSKTDDIIEHYRHSFIGSDTHDGHKVDIIESIPHDSAPVVWGKEIVTIRDDDIILEHKYFDQDFKLIKRLVTTEIKPLGGKIYATIIRMENLEEPDKWTEITHEEAKFGLKLDDSVFTLSNLRNPRR